MWFGESVSSVGRTVRPLTAGRRHRTLEDASGTPADVREKKTEPQRDTIELYKMHGKKDCDV